MVVSPVFKAMKWSEVERVSVRSAVGRQYAKVGTANLVLLAVFAILDGLLRNFGPVFYVEYGLLVMLFALVGLHGAYFGRRLAELAAAERRAESDEEAQGFAGRRRELQKLSFKVSLLDLAISAVIMILAVNI
jgi:hypothetical protein